MKKLIVGIISLACVLTLVNPAPASASNSNVLAAQKIMNKFGIPAGPNDGLQGDQTRRGLCIFRYMSKMTVTRNKLDSATLSKLRAYDKQYSSLSKIPAASQSKYYEKLVAHETCQAMTFSQANSSGKHFYKKVMRISTGKNVYNTPNGSYFLGGTQPGWHCSTIFPHTCVVNKNGMFAHIKNRADKPAGYGNMYNFRHFKNGGWGVHGSNFVPTYPDSGGCIRVTVADSDWMYNHVGNHSKPFLVVTGAYKP